jgi:hypothetical protein
MKIGQWQDFETNSSVLLLTYEEVPLGLLHLEAHMCKALMSTILTLHHTVHQNIVRAVDDNLTREL